MPIYLTSSTNLVYSIKLLVQYGQQCSYTSTLQKLTPNTKDLKAILKYQFCNTNYIILTRIDHVNY